MKNLKNYNVKDLENIKEINGGCFAWDLGWAIRSAFRVVGSGSSTTASIAAMEYGAHYASGGAH